MDNTFVSDVLSKAKNRQQRAELLAKGLYQGVALGKGPYAQQYDDLRGIEKFDARIALRDAMREMQEEFPQYHFERLIPKFWNVNNSNNNNLSPLEQILETQSPYNYSLPNNVLLPNLDPSELEEFFRKHYGVKDSKTFPTYQFLIPEEELRAKIAALNTSRIGSELFKEGDFGMPDLGHKDNNLRKSKLDPNLFNLIPEELFREYKVRKR